MLGPEAAAAFQAHRYTRLESDLHGGTLSIRKTIGAGPLEPETYAAPKAARALVAFGVATHLNNNGPVTALQVLAAHPDRRQRRRRRLRGRRRAG